ncbi:MAG: hypothetical protein A2V92_03735 [Candidatus Muproteobacteria bacterium RBG_16_65_31]|uniref:Uncharacterized protein n=1 Tax=Candidatus Muproteobacteria bacterium RBG_16_65_31 TaxID=1817759 RepID=A0A1F6THH3_9PROT|nr:MAG: hypothetical protein A2V92_03735 [Candidatus Muproteobacteria bacterium RBG_16_65_31]
MKTFKVIGHVAAVHAGLVKLGDDQARPRKHLLRPRGDGVYEVLRPIQFKQGEQFGYDGEFPKAMATVIMTTEQIEKAADAKAKTEKKSKTKGHVAEEDDKLI